MKRLVLIGIILTATASMRPVTETDSIAMTRLGSDVGNPPNASEAPAIFSPNGKAFVVLVNRGNLKNNTDEFSIIRFRSADAFKGGNPQTLLTMASSSNLPAISDIRWQPDNRTLLFLGHKMNAPQAIYAFDTVSHRLTQLTHHATNIFGFDATPDLKTIVYIAQKPETQIFNAAAQKHGVLVTGQSLVDLITGHTAKIFGPAAPTDVFIQRGNGRTVQVPLAHGTSPEWTTGITLSPDGKQAAFVAYQFGALTRPWSQYAIPADEMKFALWDVDIRTGSIHLIVNAPAACGFYHCMTWLPSGESLIVGTYLPLTVSDAKERELRKHTSWIVDIDLLHHTVQKITPALFEDVQLKPHTNVVFVEPLVNGDRGASTGVPPAQAFRKSGNHWENLGPVQITELAPASFDVRVRQGINMPPHLIAVQRRTKRTAMLMDLNPQFRHLRFGHVEQITWKGTDGVKTTGGLYLPVGYVPGRKYPLVIQTHGWDGNVFSIDGYSTAGYAAQALAGSGFVVAQIPVGVSANDGYTPREPPRVIAMFQGLIDTLAGRGLIDRQRVGLQAWSITGYIRYVLAFSKYPIAAASFYDTTEYGYFIYMTLNPNVPEEADFAADFQREFDGAIPVGAGLQAWAKHSPVFNLDKVHTPVRELAPSGTFLSDSWETYVGLKHLGKPAELVILPNALHAPVKPWERMTLQQGNVDWFRFWLQGYEDPNPAKVSQYRRWEKLCDAQKTKSGGNATFCVGTKR